MPPSKSNHIRTTARGPGSPARLGLNAAAPMLPVLACFLGGATQKWTEGIVVALFGIILLVHPPKASLGLVLNLVLLGLLGCAATAFLPASWFSQPAWRAALIDEFGVALASALSPQLW